jgi:hypothetical protein
VSLLTAPVHELNTCKVAPSSPKTFRFSRFEADPPIDDQSHVVVLHVDLMILVPSELYKKNFGLSHFNKIAWVNCDSAVQFEGLVRKCPLGRVRQSRAKSGVCWEWNTLSGKYFGKIHRKYETSFQACDRGYFQFYMLQMRRNSGRLV